MATTSKGSKKSSSPNLDKRSHSSPSSFGNLNDREMVVNQPIPGVHLAVNQNLINYVNQAPKAALPNNMSNLSPSNQENSLGYDMRLTQKNLEGSDCSCNNMDPQDFEANMQSKANDTFQTNRK